MAEQEFPQTYDELKTKYSELLDRNVELYEVVKAQEQAINQCLTVLNFAQDAVKSSDLV